MKKYLLQPDERSISILYQVAFKEYLVLNKKYPDEEGYKQIKDVAKQLWKWGRVAFSEINDAVDRANATPEDNFKKDLDESAKLQ